MDIKQLSQQDLSEILDNALAITLSNGNWKSVFPKVTNYTHIIPDFHHDMEEYPNSFRSDDHVIAHATVQFPELYPKIKKLVETILVKNITRGPFMSTIREYAGTHYIVELALKDKTYIELYTDFLLTNEDEHFQCFDFIRIVKQWDWIYETYYLLFARFFLEKDSFDDDMDYLNYSVNSLMHGHFDDETKKDVFFKAIQDYLLYIGYDPSDHEYNKLLSVSFGKMVQKHIFPHEPEKAKKFEQCYYELLESLQNHTEEEGISQSIDMEDEDIAEI